MMIYLKYNYIGVEIRGKKDLSPTETRKDLVKKINHAFTLGFDKFVFKFTETEKVEMIENFEKILEDILKDVVKPKHVIMLLREEMMKKIEMEKLILKLPTYYESKETIFMN